MFGYTLKFTKVSNGFIFSCRKEREKHPCNVKESYAKAKRETLEDLRRKHG